MGTDELFATSASMTVRLDRLGGKIPVLLIDNFYEEPDQIREMALGLSYVPPPYPYPGTLATPPSPDPSFDEVQRKVKEIVNSRYLPVVPPIAKGGSQGGPPITAFSRVISDFARIEVHPDELSDIQRIPHRDPVPVFALAYLNREERGGTLFFDQVAEAKEPGQGYFTESNSDFRLRGRIDGVFNRLAVYPGFVPHSGEIVGNWIRGEERFSNPRITQRFMFFP